jgi:hypothetical protein
MADRAGGGISTSFIPSPPSHPTPVVILYVSQNENIGGLKYWRGWARNRRTETVVRGSERLLQRERARERERLRDRDSTRHHRVVSNRLPFWFGQVGQAAAGELNAALESGGCVDEHMQDQACLSATHWHYRQMSQQTRHRQVQTDRKFRVPGLLDRVQGAARVRAERARRVEGRGGRWQERRGHKMAGPEAGQGIRVGEDCRGERPRSARRDSERASLRFPNKGADSDGHRRRACRIHAADPGPRRPRRTLTRI